MTKAFITLASLVLISILAGCSTLESLPLVGETIKAATKDEPSELETKIVADEKLNPDAQGRPAPLIIRLYALSDDSVFLTADFFALYEDDEAVLGDKLLMRREFQIRPGETRELEDLEFSLDTRYLAVIGAYRDLDNATWRVSEAIEPNESYELVMALEPLAIKLTLDD